MAVSGRSSDRLSELSVRRWRGQLRPPVTAPPFFGMLTSELDDEYLQVVEGHLKELGFRRAS
jgi:hypothetical protein